MSTKKLQATRPADLKQEKYSDGGPLDEVQYLECKLILKPDRFTAAKTFFEYGKLVARTAKKFGIDLINKGVVLKPQIREVVFLDTADFQLYNHAFILRRRMSYEDGFPTGEPEIVFKFRHPDMQKAAELDVRPKIAGNYRIKFKAEALPLKDQAGGYRLLFSHNVQFPLSQAPDGDRTSMGTLARVSLAALKTSATDTVELVDHRRGSSSGPWGAGLRQGGHRQFEHRHLARAGHAPSVVRRVRVPGKVQAPGRAPRKGYGPLSTVLRRPAAVRARLALARHDEDRARLPSQGQSAPKPRMMNLPCFPPRKTEQS